MLQIDRPYANVSTGSSANSLKDIHLKNKNIAIYQRNIELLQKEIEELRDQSFECRARGTINEITTKLQAFFNDNFPHVSLLLDDVTELLNQFQQSLRTLHFEFYWQQ